jgi:hypothetical protein
MSLRILVCGGRRYDDPTLIRRVLEEYETEFDFDPPTIVHGAAPGADYLAAREAKALGYPIEGHPANWENLGKRAGPIRNQGMIDSGVDLVIAFGGGQGTADCVARARRRGIPVRVEP